MSRAPFTRWASPAFDLLLVGDEDGSLRGLYFADAPHASIPEGAREDAAPFAAVIAQLAAYFAGERRTFDVALSPRGTPFQQAVWRELARIPYGETTTYAAIARALGKPSAARAVGAANARNPISIVVPCHRVVGQDGTLTGYAGGIDNKRALLSLEGAAIV